MARPTRILGRAAAVALGLAAGLAVGELLARTRLEAPLPERLPLLRVQANALRGWEMVPSETHYTYHHPVTVNALGLRGPEVEPRRPGELRVLALGDSLVYGQGVGDDETLPAHLEAVLAERVEGDVTVFNGGLRAYATPQELGLLRDLGDELDPDLVVLFWYWNDVDSRDSEAVSARLAESGPIAFDLGTAPEGWPLVKWRVKQWVRSSALAMAVHDALRDDADLPWLATAEDELEALPEQLAAFRAECEALGADLAVCAIPRSAALVGPDVSDPLVERALELAEGAGFPVRVLDTELKALLARTGELPIVPYDGHYSDAGNRALAIDATLWLAELGLLDARETAGGAAE